MAFMIPVVKNEWEIYQSCRSSRRSSSSSTCSNPQPCRRAASKSEPPSLSCSPGNDILFGSPRQGQEGTFGSPRRHAHAPVSDRSSQASSRHSNSSLPQSPSRNTCFSPPKSTSSNSLTKFHSKVVDKLKRTIHIKTDNDEGRETETSRTSS